MANMERRQEQDQNTGKLVMKTFYRVARQDGVTAHEIASYLKEKYGDVWRISTLVGKAEQTLNRSAVLGFLDKRGDRYIANMARELRCCRKRRRRRRCRRRRRLRGCCRRRRRRSCRRKRRGTCGCG